MGSQESALAVVGGGCEDMHEEKGGMSQLLLQSCIIHPSIYLIHV